jgi:uncharacterized protein YjiS (DUF1127 family)
MSASVTLAPTRTLRAARRLSLWQRVRAALAERHARRLLAEMDDRMLADIGAARGDAVWESSRAIWDRPVAIRQAGELAQHRDVWR